MTQLPTTPKMSVVMPVYNVEAYVAQAIESVLAQSLPDFELIIVDDGATDRSLEICRSFNDPRIRIISQKNRGLPGARNTGIAAARAPFVALLDSDDAFHVDKLLLHFVHMSANPDVAISFAGSRMIDASGRALKVAMRPQLTDISAADVLCRNPVGNGSAAVLRMSAMQLAAFPHPDEPHRTCWFDETFRQSEDIEFWTRCAVQHGMKFEGIEGLLTDYRIIGGALSANIVKQYVSWQTMLRKIGDIAPAFVAKHGGRARAFQLRYLARRAVQLGETAFARDLLVDALKADWRIAAKEPKKTAITALAVAAGSVIGRNAFAALSRRVLKGAAAGA